MGKHKKEQNYSFALKFNQLAKNSSQKPIYEISQNRITYPVYSSYKNFIEALRHI